jgi:hypothetical protein
VSASALLGVALPARAATLHPSLRALADGLRRELAPLHDRAFPVPDAKAQLTRAGGRCADDGTPLTFDPWRPRAHTCPTCGRVFHGDAHDRWWAMGAQMWCAERVLHAAILGAMDGDGALRALAARGLAALTDAWPTFPNRDNALGPTRPFFSTYLESVWLLTTALAARLLQADPAHRALVDRFRDTVAAPSRALIASFPEGRSNRQAWHVAARLVASELLGDEAGAIAAVEGRDGLRALLDNGLLPDGSWYEGENYHLFAHRGLWYGVTACEAAGHALPAALVARFDAGFVAPFRGVLPDGTFPSRRDARYAVSVHQWRFAEWCELGLARCDEPVLRRWLQRLYASGLPAGDTGRARSTGDIERDEPPVALARPDLGWRTLCLARNAPWPDVVDGAEESVMLEAQGLAVLRRDAGRLYVALESGHPGGGHGHPDRLALTLQDGGRRVLEDPGAGSYVERTLHWYRSTLAHNAPLIDGRSQAPVAARLLAFEARPLGGLLRASAEGIAPGVRVTRTVALVDEHVVDVCAWEADRAVRFELPLHHALRSLDDADFRADDPAGAGGLEDGFDFLGDVASVPWTSARVARWRGDEDVRVWSAVHGGEVSSVSLWRATAPGPPRRPARGVHWWRAIGRSGQVSTVWSLRGAVRAVAFDTGGLPVRVALADGTTVVHTDAAERWQVDLTVGEARSRLDFDGRRPAPPTIARPPVTAPAPVVDLRAAPLVRVLGRDHYRRSEPTWEEAGRPSATVTLDLAPDGDLLVQVDARTGDLVVPPAGAENPFDNERADVDADGIQCYLGAPADARWRAAWLLVPERETGLVRCTDLVASGAHDPAPTWEPSTDGFRLALRLPRGLLEVVADGDGCVRFDLLVNERSPDRARRRGQLVLSGAREEFVYLRGDRHDPARALLLRGPWRAAPSRSA